MTPQEGRPPYEVTTNAWTLDKDKKIILDFKFKPVTVNIWFGHWYVALLIFSQASRMAQGMALSAGHSHTLVQTEIRQLFDGLHCLDIHGIQRMFKWRWPPRNQPQLYYFVFGAN